MTKQFINQTHVAAWFPSRMSTGGAWRVYECRNKEEAAAAVNSGRQDDWFGLQPVRLATQKEASGLHPDISKCPGLMDYQRALFDRLHAALRVNVPASGNGRAKRKERDHDV